MNAENAGESGAEMSADEGAYGSADEGSYISGDEGSVGAGDDYQFPPIVEPELKTAAEKDQFWIDVCLFPVYLTNMSY